MAKRLLGFVGFDEEEETIGLPASFFQHLLPAVDDLAELKLTLCLLYRRARAGAPVLFLRQELEQDPELHHILGLDGQRAENAVGLALERAAARGTLLTLRRARGNQWEEAYVLNEPAGRRLAEELAAGEPAPEAAGEPGPAPWRLQRPNIFVLYEQNIGLLQPLIAEELREAERTYPMSWIEDAFRIAAERNVRNWRYVRAILERWAQEGKQDEITGRDSEGYGRRYIEGKYGRYVKR
jgi:DnaD/phage-associated family protein